jgi:hypothetical protein
MAQRPVSLVRLQYLLNMDLYLKESFSCIAISFEKAFAYEAGFSLVKSRSRTQAQHVRIAVVSEHVFETLASSARSFMRATGTDRTSG